MLIRFAYVDNAPSNGRIIGLTIRAGETYALDRGMTEADGLAYWLGNDRETVAGGLFTAAWLSKPPSGGAA